MWSTTGESEFIMADRLGNIYPSDKCCPFLFPGKPGFPGNKKGRIARRVFQDNNIL